MCNVQCHFMCNVQCHCVLMCNVQCHCVLMCNVQCHYVLNDIPNNSKCYLSMVSDGNHYFLFYNC